MNQYFNSSKIKELYPGAEELMLPSMLIWKLPSGKENMMEEVCSNGEYFAQEKVDGAWYQFVKGGSGENYLFGRTISKVTGLLTEKGQNVPHILSALDNLPPMTALIGEIYFDGCTAKDTVSIMGCLSMEAIKRQESGRGKIKYYIHDIIYYDNVNLMHAGAWDRYRILNAIWKKHNLSQYPFLRLARVVEDNIEEEISNILNSGGEGMVLKKKTAPYVPDKRPAWSSIKFKQMDDVDLICTRTIPATKEYTGKEIETWPYWERKLPNGETEVKLDTCYYGEDGWNPVTKPYALGWHTSIGVGAYSEDGKLVELGTVSSGLTDEDRAAMGKAPEDFIGAVISLHCMSIDKKEKTLRHPSFKSWRRDKNPTDCKINDIFN